MLLLNPRTGLSRGGLMDANSMRIVENMGWELFIWAWQKVTPWGSGRLTFLQAPGFIEKRKTENILNHLFPSCDAL